MTNKTPGTPSAFTNRNALHLDLDAKSASNRLFAGRLASVLPLQRGTSVLEVGCGGGELSFFLGQTYGLDCYGLEPFPLYASKLEQGRIAQAVAERIPFADNSFDLVIAKDVIEHVDDVQQSLNEMLRVSRKYVYLACPNYLFPYEAHFKVPFIPLLPKPLARAYLRVLGFARDKIGFIDHINYITKPGLYRKIRRASRQHRLVAVIDLQLAKKYSRLGFPGALVDLFTNYKIELLLVKEQVSAESAPPQK